MCFFQSQFLLSYAYLTRYDPINALAIVVIGIYGNKRFDHKKRYIDMSPYYSMII